MIRFARGLLLLSLAACSDRDAQAKQSAARVARAIELVREAPNAGKGAVLPQLGAAACAAPDVCQTRDRCRAAYALHVEATSLTAAAAHSMSRGNAQEAAALLGSAQEKLGQAGMQIDACMALERALRQKYRL